jgi:predicted nucleic acid-binding protein
LSVVIDSSVALNWIMPDEHDPDAERLLHAVAVSGAAVPPLFRIEVGQGLLMGVRRKRVPASFPREAIELLDSLPLRFDADGAELAWTASMQLATTHGLTLYDATYLELAVRLGVTLATFDKGLARAAAQAGVASPWPQQGMN